MNGNPLQSTISDKKGVSRVSSHATSHFSLYPLYPFCAMLWICVVAFLKKPYAEVSGSPKIGAFRHDSSSNLSDLENEQPQLLGEGYNGQIITITRQINGKSEQLACKSCLNILNDLESLKTYQRFDNERWFLNELKIANHPNIILLKEDWKDSFQDHLGLDLCLGDIRFVEFTDEQLIVVFDDMLSALVYLHHNDIYHGDIKPGNILYKCDKDIRYILADFESASYGRYGLFRHLLYGTLEYLPTILVGSLYGLFRTRHNYDKQQLDIYALGKTLFYFIICKNNNYCMNENRGVCFSTINGKWHLNYMNVEPYVKTHEELRDLDHPTAEFTFDEKYLDSIAHPLKEYMFKMMSCFHTMSANDLLSSLRQLYTNK